MNFYRLNRFLFHFLRLRSSTSGVTNRRPTRPLCAALEALTRLTLRAAHQGFPPLYLRPAAIEVKKGRTKKRGRSHCFHSFAFVVFFRGGRAGRSGVRPARLPVVGCATRGPLEVGDPCSTPTHVYSNGPNYENKDFKKLKITSYRYR